MLIRRYLSCIRYHDILFLQGSPLLGAAFALGEVTANRLGMLLVFAAASILLVAHVFVLNDWAGADYDLNDAHRVSGVFSTKGLDRQAMRWLWVVLLVTSLVLFSLLGWRPLVIAEAIAVLSALYSQPAKGVPIVSSALHLVGGSLHFLLGYSLFRGIDGQGVAIAVFFGLTFAAGHLNQEVRDCDDDARNAIRTNAVAFGKRATFLAGLVVFTLAYVQLVVLAVDGIAPRWLAALAVLYPLQLFWSLQTLAAGLSFDSVRRLQRRYRALFALIGVAMVMALLVHPHGVVRPRPERAPRLQETTPPRLAGLGLCRVTTLDEA